MNTNLHYGQMYTLGRITHDLPNFDFGLPEVTYNPHSLGGRIIYGDTDSAHSFDEMPLLEGEDNIPL